MEWSEEDYDYIFKIIVVGNSGVGKSNIAHRFTSNNFDDASDFTIGVEFDEKVMNIKGKKVKVQLWDSSGKKMYMTIAKKHFDGWLGWVVVFDVTDSRSFDDANNWMKEVEKAADPSCQFLIMANKWDFTNKYPRMNQVPNTKVEGFVKSHNVLYFGESSAKKNLNIEKPINKLIEHVFDTQMDLIEKGTKNEESLKIAPEMKERRNQSRSWIIF